jgi:hypothetical protein
MSQQQHRFFRVVDEFACQVRLIFENQCDTVGARKIAGRNDGEFVPGDFVSEPDLANPPAGDGRTHRRAIEHAGKRHIVDVNCLPGNFIRAFFALNRLSDELRLHICSILALSLPLTEICF